MLSIRICKIANEKFCRRETSKSVVEFIRSYTIKLELDVCSRHSKNFLLFARLNNPTVHSHIQFIWKFLFISTYFWLYSQNLHLDMNKLCHIFWFISWWFRWKTTIGMRRMYWIDRIGTTTNTITNTIVIIIRML